MLLHVYQVSVRTVLCGWNRRCGTSNVPHGKKRCRRTLHILLSDTVALRSCCFQLRSVVDRWVLQVCGAVCVIGSVMSVFRV